MYNMIKIINTAIYYIWKPLREGILRIPKDSHDKKKNFFLILYLHEMMNVH